MLKREGCDIKIHNGDKTWTVDFQYDENFADPQRRRSLHIKESPRETGDQDTLEIVLTKLPRGPYRKAISQCLRLQEAPPQKNVFKGILGTFYWSDEHRGKVFIKGMFVQNIEQLMVGVDLSTDEGIRLGRDRNCVNEPRFAAHYMHIWSEAMCGKNKYARMMHDRLIGKERQERVSSFEERFSELISDDGARAMAKHWKSQSVRGALPLEEDGKFLRNRSIAESVFFRKAVGLKRSFYNVIATSNEVDTLTTLKMKLRMLLQQNAIANGSSLGLEIADNNRPSAEMPILSPIKDGSFFPVIKAKLREEPVPQDTGDSCKARMTAIASCLVKVLGVEEGHIHFNKFATSEFLPVFTEAGLGEDRVVLAAPKLDDTCDELHPATIYEPSTAGCLLDFGDGSDYIFRDWGCIAAPSSAHEKPHLEIGMAVACPWNGEKIWYKGTIKRILQGGYRIEVGWDDTSDPVEFDTKDCAFFLADGNVIDQQNVFVNIGALDIDSAHKYFDGHCLDKRNACSCVYRMVTSSVRKTLGRSSDTFTDHNYHHRLGNFINEYPDEDIDWTSTDNEEPRIEIPVQACKTNIPERPQNKHFPDNWPEGVRFCSSLEFRSTEDYIKNLSVPYSIPNIEIRKIDRPSHPCYGVGKNEQFGVFALDNFTQGHEFGHYTGEVKRRTQFLKEVDKKSKGTRYHMNFGRDEDFVIDAEECGNELRYVNDYRNIADEANVEFVLKDDRSRGLLSAVLQVKTSIMKGDELLCDYGQDYWERQGMEKTPQTGKRKRSPDAADISEATFLAEEYASSSSDSSSEDSDEDGSGEYFPDCQ